MCTLIHDQFSESRESMHSCCKSVSSLYWVKIATVNGEFLYVEMEVGVECCTVDKDHLFKISLLS